MSNVYDAQNEAEEAEALLEALEERVREGDESVSPDEIATAERLGRFARLRVEAARRKAAAAKVEAVERECVAAGDAALAFVGSLRDLSVLQQEAAAAFAKYKAACDEQAGRARLVGNRVEAALAEAGRHGLQSDWIETPRGKLRGDATVLLTYVDGIRLEHRRKSPLEIVRDAVASTDLQVTGVNGPVA
ncbi:hypothetical protein [Nocardioides sp.]|uniref:hypothetical protein n=1 Tax=Nocardioides sp. TaxID=35761 RepID=UPI002C098187|nr:hypothetical protein [Nocardioides sp.]HSX68660.1 hypothetical protein [Nocardioides sp.]